MRRIIEQIKRKHTATYTECVISNLYIKTNFKNNLE